MVKFGPKEAIEAFLPGPKPDAAAGPASLVDPREPPHPDAPTPDERVSASPAPAIPLPANPD